MPTKKKPKKRAARERQFTFVMNKTKAIDMLDFLTEAVKRVGAPIVLRTLAEAIKRARRSA